MAELTQALAPAARRRSNTGLVVSTLLVAALVISVLGLSDSASFTWF
jgi:hypothetical protein